MTTLQWAVLVSVGVLGLLALVLTVDRARRRRRGLGLSILDDRPQPEAWVHDLMEDDDIREMVAKRRRREGR